MDAVRVALLREVLAGTEWLTATRRFAGSLRASVAPHGGGMLLVGTDSYEPWHLRYIGVEAATDMANRGINTVEEYFGVEAAPGYP